MSGAASETGARIVATAGLALDGPALAFAGSGNARTFAPVFGDEGSNVEVLVQLTGALSNPSVKADLARLLALKDQILLTSRHTPRQPTPSTLKNGAVKAHLIQLLDQADRPLRTIELHSLLESQLGYRLAKSTVRSALYSAISESEPRVARVGHGLYYYITALERGLRGNQ